FGFESIGKSIAKIASPEKALIDFLYLSPSKSNLFKALPELEFPKSFAAKRARRIINRIRSTRRKNLVNRLFEELLSRYKRI
ncbi:MAG: hypothetical protein KAU47_06840, partial [Candidatus Aminicenantes bacterium]|nr:hypothetical protein [Candidatus Aminicenantes bacterium]